MEKAAVVAHLRTVLAQRAAALDAELSATLEARNSDTKSSAGDKHEVGRAMVQQELDQLEGRSASIRSMQQELARVPMDRVHEQVGFGSLVVTDRGTFFIAIGTGAVDTMDGTCFAISLASPIGQMLRGKRIGDTVTVNGRAIRILSLS
ncbi:MAG: 3-oxoacyl-ACP synthase [Flavobacteriales bacterium]